MAVVAPSVYGTQLIQRCIFKARPSTFTFAFDQKWNDFAFAHRHRHNHRLSLKTFIWMYFIASNLTPHQINSLLVSLLCDTKIMVWVSHTLYTKFCSCCCKNRQTLKNGIIHNLYVHFQSKECLKNEPYTHTLIHSHFVRVSRWRSKFFRYCFHRLSWFCWIVRVRVREKEGAREWERFYPRSFRVIAKKGTNTRENHFYDMILLVSFVIFYDNVKKLFCLGRHLLCSRAVSFLSFLFISFSASSSSFLSAHSFSRNFSLALWHSWRLNHLCFHIFEKYHCKCWLMCWRVVAKVFCFVDTN